MDDLVYTVYCTDLSLYWISTRYIEVISQKTFLRGLVAQARFCLVALEMWDRQQD